MTLHEDRILIFSYGSNMLSKRLIERAPSAQTIGIGVLQGFKVEFNKESKDHSGKATLIETNNNDFVWGVISSLSKDDKQKLDQAEELNKVLDKGYNELPVTIKTDSGKEICTLTYIANKGSIVEGLIPFKWYMNLVLEGARENGLPIDYIKKFENQRCK